VTSETFGNNRKSDTGQHVSGNYAVSLHTHSAPMTFYNGGLRLKMNRLPPTTDADLLPHQSRSYVNASGAQDVQINNGLQNRVAAGLRTPYFGTGWLFAAAPRIPGQTRGDVAGFHARGPSPLNYQSMWQSGPGSQPDNPGGPGRIAASQFVNPMTG
jgi:hypothetical protein